MVIVAASGPSWLDAVTAFATVGAVVAAVGIALWTERRSDKRVREERTNGRTQLDEERRLAREREQLNEAYRVQVVLGERWGASVGHTELGDPGPAETKLLAVMVSNCGSYPITRVEAQFCLDRSMIQPHRYERFASAANLPDALRGDYRPAAERPLRGVLTPFDWGIRFESDEIHVKFLISPYPVVRWTDDWGTRWEHRRGVARRIAEDEEWAA